MNNDVAGPKWQPTGALMLSALALGVAFTTMMTKSPQPNSQPDGKPSGITVSGHSRKTAVPDTAFVSMGIVTREKTSRDAVTKNAKAAQSIMNAIEALGIDKKDIQTQNYSLEPWVSYTNRGKPKRLGYTVQNTVRVTVRDIKKVSDVADGGTKAGANSVQGVEFGLDDNEKINREALAAAVENARGKAEAVAKTLGARVGKPLSITDSPSEDYDPYAHNYAYSARRFKMNSIYSVETTPISPGQIEVTQNVQVTFAVEK
jgi:uncharacterized protein YggE